MKLNEAVSIIDCNNCVKILQYLDEHGEAEVRELDGYMRTNGITTTIYHLNKHLEPNELVITSKRGMIRKRNFVKITAKGKKVLDKTLGK